jgi:hypothetical protein
MRSIAFSFFAFDTFPCLTHSSRKRTNAPARRVHVNSLTSMCDCPIFCCRANDRNGLSLFAKAFVILPVREFLETQRAGLLIAHVRFLKLTGYA